MNIFFNMHKIKFNILEMLIPGCCTTLTKDSKVNVYINLEPVIRRMINSGQNDELKVRKEDRVIEFISCVFNLATHYRLFFTKHKIYSKVYIYYGHPFEARCSNKDINPEYRNNMSDLMLRNPKTRAMTNVINDAIPLLKTIMEYIEGVYFLESHEIEPSVIPYKIYKDHSDDITHHFLVTNDRYEYQYAAMDNFFILRPKADNSYIICKENLIEQVKYEEKVVSDISTHYNMISFILSIMGNEPRNVPKIKGLGVASIIRLINKANESGIISDEVNNIFILNKAIKDEYVEQVMNNYLCTDVVVQYGKLKIKDYHCIESQIVDRFDNQQLKRLNDAYFKFYPLYLMEILAALKLKKQERIKF